MTYIENPKTKGSGIICAIPQKGICPNMCEDCFFQSGRSFLEPLDENTPNIPSIEEIKGRVVRVNDGNDSSNQMKLVMESVKDFPMKFYNTSNPYRIDEFDAPVVLTLNPGKKTDVSWWAKSPIPKNLMFVRIRTNMWNINKVVIPAVKFYSEREVPIVLTFMAYFDTADKIKVKKFYYIDGMKDAYIFRKRTLNKYWAITTIAWKFIMEKFQYNKWVYSCSKIEGEKGTHACHRCGNCLREYFYTMEKMRNES